MLVYKNKVIDWIVWKLFPKHYWKKFNKMWDKMYNHTDKTYVYNITGLDVEKEMLDQRIVNCDFSDETKVRNENE